VDSRHISPARCLCSGSSQFELWVTLQAAECLLTARFALVIGCSLAHGAAVYARVYVSTYQYYDWTYEFYVQTNCHMTSLGGRSEPYSGSECQLHMKVNIPNHIRSRMSQVEA
jgi:hypothetical protein